jgi:hypothetical protein
MAIWEIMMLDTLSPVDVRWLAGLGDRGVSLLSSLGVLATLGFEIGFAFLIWNPNVRPWLLRFSLLLHGGIGLLMGLWVFSGVMLTGCLAFVPPEAVRAFLKRWHRRLLRCLPSLRRPQELSAPEPQVEPTGASDTG